jgi:hypothetical protein
MDEERLDLSALDPRSRPERWEGMVSGILAHAPAAVRERGLLAVLGEWARPALAAASFVGLVSAGLLALSLERDGAPPRAQTLAESLLPAPLDEWVADGRMPSEVDLLTAWGDVAPPTERGGRPR